MHKKFHTNIFLRKHSDLLDYISGNSIWSDEDEMVSDFFAGYTIKW